MQIDSNILQKIIRNLQRTDLKLLQILQIIKHNGQKLHPYILTLVLVNANNY